jgi:hypothetical protein
MARNYQDLDRVIQSCLQSLEDGESLDVVLSRYPGLEDSILPPLEAAMWLGGIKTDLDPSTGYVAASRKRLVSQIRRGDLRVKPAQGFSIKDFIMGLGKQQVAFQFALALLLLVFLVVGTASVSLAARNTIPGDRLYPVKLAKERVRLAFSFTASGDARLHAEFAQERLVEIQRLVLENQLEYLDQTVARYDHQVAQLVASTRVAAERGGSQTMDLVENMEEVLTGQQLILSSLEQRVPVQSQQGIAQALATTRQALTSVETIRSLLPAAGTPTPTPTRTLLPSNTPTPIFNPIFDPTSTRTNQPVIVGTSSLGSTPAPTQLSRPENPPTPTPSKTPKPTKQKPKPTNPHRPTKRPPNPNKPVKEPGD